MNPKARWLLLVLLLAGASPAALRAQNNEKFIEGTWRLSGQLPGSGKAPGMSWFLEWTFAGGTFRQTGYPPLQQEGRYRVGQNRENRLTLELYDQSGTFGSDRRPIEIVVDRARKTLVIDGKEGFTRTAPRKP